MRKIAMKLTKSLSIRLYELLKSEFTHSSANLKKFASKKSYLKNHNRILKGSDGELYIGINDDGWLTGARLNSVICGDFKTWAFADKTIACCEDVTEWFINEYKEKGMCAYTDWRHEWDTIEHEQTKDGTTRKCIHCGKEETLHSKMVRKTWWE